MAVAVDHSGRPPRVTKKTALDIQKKKGLGPFFYKLPQELRLEIFGYCVALGHPQFMRASRILRNEGNAVISKKGIYRMRLGQMIDNNGQYPSQEVAKTIQHLEVSVDVPPRTLYYPISGWDRLKPFEDPDTPRGKCKIVVKAENIMDVIALAEMFYFVSCLRGFEEMLIHVIIFRDQAHDLFPSLIQSPGEYRFLELVGESLFEQLGEGQVEFKAYGFAWRFYPRQHLEKIGSRAEKEP
ncbi:hypothetical protein BDR22DRAFT_824106 [Usnea florida]